MTTWQIEERRKNLTFIRKNKPPGPDDYQFTTTLIMQEQWLATVDALERQMAAVRREINTTAHVNEKACEHAMCGLAMES